jgi:thioredoxin-like negative regulator of GroEL
MAGKLTTVLTKREAETYRSQGLHKEALGLYKNLISSSPNLGTDFKDAIQGQINTIQAEIQGDPAQEDQMLSATEIQRIKKGWGGNATEGDLLVCAQAFCQVGHYQEALSGVATLLQNGCAMGKVVNLYADCLVHLHTPAQLAEALNPLVQQLFAQPQARLRFAIQLTEAMVNLKQARHAEALYQQLKQHPVISQKAPQRLSAIAKGIEALQAAPKDETRQPDTVLSDPSCPQAGDMPSSNWLASLKNRFLKLTGSSKLKKS